MKEALIYGLVKMEAAAPFSVAPPQADEDGEDMKQQALRLMATIGDCERVTLDHLIASLRETIGVNRVALFLDCQHPSAPSDPYWSTDRLLCVGGIGIPTEAQETHELSKRNGIGKWVTRHGQILDRNLAKSFLPAVDNIEVQEEFESLKCHFAIPVNDRHSTIGVALLGQPLVRSRFTDEELQTAFHLMEEFGLSIRNFRRQQKLAWDNKILRQMLSVARCGTLVVTDEFKVMKANPAIKDYFGMDPRQKIEFDDIPAMLAEQIRGAMGDFEPCVPFFLSFPEDPRKRLLRVTLAPQFECPCQDSHCLIVVLEDFSEMEAAKQHAIDAAISRLSAQLQLLGSNI